jgi:hypothetical protein
MIYRTELIILHILDLLELLEVNHDGEDGTLSLMVDGEEQVEVDFDDLCLVVRTTSDRSASPSPKILPMSATSQD